MSNTPIDMGRRKFLTATTAVVGAFGLAATSVPFIRSWNPSAKAKASGAPVEVNIASLQPGQLIRVEWRGKPVWIVKRTPQVLEQLKMLDNQLRDPFSEEPQQPDYAMNSQRSVRPDIFVAVGICTHLGCSPTYLAKAFSEQVEGISSGFFCPCHGSKFDMAGRVFQSVPAPLNLVVPPHYFIDEKTIMIGIDQGEVLA